MNSRNARRVVAVVQARMNSSRLPGKVLMPIGSRTMIDRVLDQLAGSRTVNEVVVATSGDRSDDPLAMHLAARGATVVRGDLADVLRRFVSAARRADADVVVRLTADCPLVSPDTVDDVVEGFLAAGVDYATNTSPYTRPDGMDVEVMSREALERADREARDVADREHVTPFLRRHPEVSRLSVRHGGPPGRGLRLTVDVPADLEYVREIWGRLDAIAQQPHCYEVIMEAVKQVGAHPAPDTQNRGYYRSLYQQAEGVKAAALRLGESERWLERSRRTIPGQAQTYSKSWRQHIHGVSPVFLSHGRGARVWDVDGNEFVDLVQGLLPNILGYADSRVDQAVYERCRKGHSFSLAHPLEVEVAEKLAELIPCAERVRFGKNGSDATSGAIRIARAFTRRDRVAVCGYHGWHDWYIATTSRNAGVPRAVGELSHTFPYNDLAALERLLNQHSGEFAAIIMEPFNFVEPEKGFLDGVKKAAERHGAVLIFDEICTGFHFGLGGAQKMLGVVPHMAVFGKAMGNGYPISCIVGRADIMERLEDVFVSFTFAGDAAGLTAARQVIEILERTDALDRIAEAGSLLRYGTLALAEEAGLAHRFRMEGREVWSLLRFLDEDGRDDPVLKTFWLQEVTRRGVLLLNTHNLCAALDRAEVEHVLRAYAEAFKYVGARVAAGDDLRAHLDGPVPSPPFRVRG